MPTPSNLGTFQTTPGTTETVATATGVSGTNGRLMVLKGFFNQQSADTVNPTMAIGGTWSGTWTKRANCYRSSTPTLTYKEGVEIWTAPITGSPSGTITYTNPQTVTDGWMGFELLEIDGAHASPIGLSASPSEQVSTSTFNTDLGATPNATSLVVGVIHDNNQSGPAVVPPSGWTEADEQSPAWGAITEWAYKNGSAVQSPQWSGFTNSASVRIMGCALEILAAAAGAQTITPSGIASVETFGTAKINTKVAATGIASTEAFGTAKINMRVAATGIATAEAFGAAVLAPGAVAIAPAGIASTETFGSAIVASGATIVAPSGIASAEAFGGATLLAGAVTITPAGMASLEAFGTAKINARIAATGIASLEAFGSASLTSNAKITINGIASTEAFGAATVVPAGVTITPAGIASVEVFGNHLATQGDAYVLPNGIASAETFGTASLKMKITGTGIASTEAFGTAALLTGAALQPISIPSGEAFGAAMVAAGAVIVAPVGIGSLEAFGTAKMNGRLGGAGIASVEAFGTALLAQGNAIIRASGIASGEAFGFASLLLEIVIDPDAPVAAAFLDRYERFAKSEDAIVTVRVFYGANVFEDLTYAQFRALPKARRELITNSGSGAGRIDTSTKSNA